MIIVHEVDVSLNCNGPKHWIRKLQQCKGQKMQNVLVHLSSNVVKWMIRVKSTSWTVDLLRTLVMQPWPASFYAPSLSWRKRCFADRKCSLQLTLVGCILCWNGVAVSCTPMFLGSWSLQALARTGKSLLLCRSACVVYLPNKGTDLYLVYLDNASAAVDSVMSNSVLLHQGEAANQTARAQPLPRLAATVDIMPVVMPFPCDPCT